MCLSSSTGRLRKAVFIGNYVLPSSVIRGSSQGAKLAERGLLATVGSHETTLRKQCEMVVNLDVDVNVNTKIRNHQKLS